MLKSITPKIVRKSEMSVEEKDKTPQKTLKSTSNQQSFTKVEQPKLADLKAVVHNTNTLRFHKLCGELINDQDDNLLAVVPYNPPYTQKNYLIVKNLVYIISNWTHDKYPNVIYICLRGYDKGYSDVKIEVNPSTGFVTYSVIQTNRIAALQLDQVTSTMDESNVRTYELRYSIRDSVSWQLASEQSLLQFEMRVDDSDTPQIMPLPSPLAFNFEVRSSL